MNTVRLEVDDAGIAIVTLDGPEKLNAFSAQTGQELGEAYRRCHEDDDIRAVVLTGAGRAFCAGADMSEDSLAFAARDTSFSASPVVPPAWEVRKVVVAAINGHAIGIGLTIALQCDIRLVSETAKLAIPQVRLGMVPDAQSHFTLRQAVGQAVAAEVLLTGTTYTGTEAVRLGMASRALPAAEVLPAAVELARDIAVNANPLAVAMSKRLLWADLGMEEVGAEETRLHHELMRREDAAEGPRAWREGRPPHWTSRASEA
ncbi:enoyl-CoA hydratase-related protein [Nocardioides sp.]|uniref:enoyl-CoA hydratase/isomerase family protein n=1 Tax=Nocardioides sp. TaxID=35761 RepID=UPI0031FE822F|nr:crotonase [Nocardioides sp.]